MGRGGVRSKIPIETLVDLYHTQRLTLKETAAIVGISFTNVRQNLKKHGVPTRTTGKHRAARHAQP